MGFWKGKSLQWLTQVGEGPVALQGRPPYLEGFRLLVLPLRPPLRNSEDIGEGDSPAGGPPLPMALSLPGLSRTPAVRFLMETLAEQQRYSSQPHPAGQGRTEQT